MIVRQTGALLGITLHKGCMKRVFIAKTPCRATKSQLLGAVILNLPLIFPYFHKNAERITNAVQCHS